MEMMFRSWFINLNYAIIVLVLLCPHTTSTEVFHDIFQPSQGRENEGSVVNQVIRVVNVL